MTKNAIEVAFASDAVKEHESFPVFAYYFSQMIITALNYQEQVKEKRKKGANMSDKEKTLISHLLYLSLIHIYLQKIERYACNKVQVLIYNPPPTYKNKSLNIYQLTSPMIY